MTILLQQQLWCATGLFTVVGLSGICIMLIQLAGVRVCRLTLNPVLSPSVAVVTTYYCTISSVISWTACSHKFGYVSVCPWQDGGFVVADLGVAFCRELYNWSPVGCPGTPVSTQSPASCCGSPLGWAGDVLAWLQQSGRCYCCVCNLCLASTAKRAGAAAGIVIRLFSELSERSQSELSGRTAFLSASCKWMDIADQWLCFLLANDLRCTMHM